MAFLYKQFLVLKLLVLNLHVAIPFPCARARMCVCMYANVCVRERHVCVFGGGRGAACFSLSLSLSSAYFVFFVSVCLPVSFFLSLVCPSLTYERTAVLSQLFIIQLLTFYLVPPLVEHFLKFPDRGRKWFLLFHFSLRFRSAWFIGISKLSF